MLLGKKMQATTTSLFNVRGTNPSLVYDLVFFFSLPILVCLRKRNIQTYVFYIYYDNACNYKSRPRGRFRAAPKMETN